MKPRVHPTSSKPVVKRKARKKTLARPRVVWQVNPLTQVVPSKKTYGRHRQKKILPGIEDE